MNSINRNNYETFFLLYADNELPVAERNAVDEFVLANPDLQEELVMLQQSILKPDYIVFDDKKSLFKNEFIITPIQEKLLLYLDDELTTVEKNEIGQLIATDAAVEKEWVILLQTRVMADAANVFEDKPSLYRKEPGKTISFPWWRVAVAACFIGMGAWVGLVYFNNGHKPGGTEIAVKPPTKATPDSFKETTPKTGMPVVIASLKKEERLVRNGIVIKVPKRAAIQSPGNIAMRTVTGKPLEIVAVKEKTNNLPTPYFDNINNIGGNKIITAHVTPEKQLPGNNTIVRNTINQDPATVFASNTSFTNSGEDNNDRVLFMDEEKVKKTKLGGIFKKVKRVLERSANIKPGGNNIKVANLEFAIQ